MSKLIWLTLGAFAVGTETLVIAGILPQIADDFGQSLAFTGQLVTLFALTYAVGSPVMAVVTGSIERKRLLVATLSLFAVANVVAALAPGYAALVAARLLLALAAATFMPAASAYAALSVEPQRRGRALALVYAGLTVATVLGVPIGTFIGQAVGWRFTFVAVAILSVLAVAGIAAALPRLAAPPPVSLAERWAVARRKEVLGILLLTVLTLGGALTIYTYIAPFLTGAIGFDAGTIPLVLVAFGVAGAIGNLMSGYVGDRWELRKYVAVLLVVLSCAFILLSLVATELDGAMAKALVVVGIAAWGLSGWGLPAAQQQRLVKLEPSHAPVLISLNASAIYLGTALGAALGSLAITLVPVGCLGFVAAGMEVLGLVVLLATAETRREAAGEAKAGAIAGERLAAAPGPASSWPRKAA